MSARSTVRRLEGWIMRFLLVAQDRGDGTVRLLDPSVHTSRQDALDAVGEGPREDEDLFVVDLDDAAPVLMVRAPQSAQPPSQPEETRVVEEPEPEPEVRPEVRAPVFHVVAPEAAPLVPVVEPVVVAEPSPHEPSAAADETPTPPAPVLMAPEPLEAAMPAEERESEQPVGTTSEAAAPVLSVEAPAFAAALRDASAALGAPASDEPSPVAPTPAAPLEERWPRPDVEKPAMDEDDAEVSTPSFNAFTYPVRRGSPAATDPKPSVDATPVTDDRGGASESVAHDDAVPARPATAGSYDGAPVGREDLAAALEQLAAVAQFSAGLTTGDVAGKDAAGQGPVAIVSEVPSRAEEDKSPVPDPIPRDVDGRPPLVDRVGVPDVHVGSTPMVVAAAEEPAPPVVPSKEDVAGWTCSECVYVTTCPRSGQDRPATCGSFQWRTG